jgi:threonine/homoserine/homoserine lactone efflux protein
MLVVMNTATRRSIGVTMVIIGIVMGAIGLVLDLNGGPSALHVLTWVGGGLFGYGFVTLIYSRRGELK